MTGLHGLHVIAGILLLSVMLVLVVRKKSRHGFQQARKCRALLASRGCDLDIPLAAVLSGGVKLVEGAMEQTEIHGHIIPYRTFVRVWLLLLVLTAYSCVGKQALSRGFVRLGDAVIDSDQGGSCLLLFHAFEI